MHTFRYLRKRVIAGIQTKKSPWIQPEHAGKEEIIAQVKKCPSGALSIKE